MVKLALRRLLNKFKIGYTQMRRETLKDAFYGGLTELLKNPNIYYTSSIGKEYSKFTAKGREEIVEWIENQAREIAEAEEQFLDERAKKLVLDELKR